MKQALFLLLLAFSRDVLAWGTPDWVKAAAKMPLPAYPAGTAGVVLIDETTATVRNDGAIETRRRQAFRILSTEGRDLAQARVDFSSLVELVSFHAWSIAGNGDEWEVKEREAMERGLSDNTELYTDEKRKIIQIPAAEPGTVTAFEYVTRERTPQVLQDSWTFQRELPVRSARYTLVLPRGWSHDETWFNAVAKEPRIDGESVIWEVADVPAIADEVGRPPQRAVAGRLAVNFYPHAQTARRSWNDIGVWYNGLIAGRRTITPEMRAKVTELTAGDVDTIGNIAKLAGFVQKDIRYVAIEIGVGGHQPHAASEIFANRYGDCKDKVTLLSAMLQAIGVESHYVIATTRRGTVDQQFASLDAFNHVIIAIRLPREMKSNALHAIVEHPKAGRLLLFDPTSMTTPLGELPGYAQRNRGLLITETGGDLIELPPFAPETNQFHRTATLALDDAGLLSGVVTETSRGTVAAVLREELQPLTNPKRLQMIEQQVGLHLANFKISNLNIYNLDDMAKNLVIRYTLSASSYGKKAGPLLLVRPRVLGEKAETQLDLKNRKYDYETEGSSLQVDEIEIAVPPSFTPDELPQNTKIANETLSYESETSFDKGVLHYKRQYRMKQYDVPVGRLAELNKAFAAILADERSSAVFKAKN